MVDSIINFDIKPPKLKGVEDKTKVNLRYMLIEPYVSVHIYWNSQIGDLMYELEEPLLSAKETEDLEKLKKSIQEIINFNTTSNKEKGVIEYIDIIMKKVILETAMTISDESYKKIFYYIYRDFVGLNEIEPLIHDYYIEDIECNGVGQPIFIVHRVFRNLKTNVRFDDLEKAASFVEKIAQKCGRYVSYANPILDGTLPDGSRVNATYTKDISSRGPTFTIRKFTKDPWTPIQLLGFATLSPEMLAYLWILMQNKMNVLIAGGTGSGKTTLLNAIAFFIPPEARVVSIEDTRELNLPRENWLPSVARSGTSLKGAGEVDMFSLLKSSFRQNPDYVIVGEVRGQEASVLFQGMASGHASMSTLHADSVETVIRRLETPPIELSPTLVNELDAVAVMAHVVIGDKETRKLREIIEVINVNADGTAQTNTPFMWDAARDLFFFKKQSHVFEKIQKRTGVTQEVLWKEFETRTRIIHELYKRGMNNMEQIKKVVNDYYKNPTKVLQELGLA